MVGVGNGELLGYGLSAPLMWTGEPLATIQQADNYAEPRGWADWLALQDAQKTAALLDATTFITATYAAPRRLAPSQEALITNAAIEAARLTLSGPLIGVVQEPQILKEGMKGFVTEYAEQKAGAAFASRLSLVSALLRSAGLCGGSTINVPLRKA